MKFYLTFTLSRYFQEIKNEMIYFIMILHWQLFPHYFWSPTKSFLTKVDSKLSPLYLCLRHRNERNSSGQPPLVYLDESSELLILLDLLFLYMQEFLEQDHRARYLTSLLPPLYSFLKYNEQNNVSDKYALILMNCNDQKIGLRSYHSFSLKRA